MWVCLAACGSGGLREASSMVGVFPAYALLLGCCCCLSVSFLAFTCYVPCCHVPGLAGVPCVCAFLGHGVREGSADAPPLAPTHLQGVQRCCLPRLPVPQGVHWRWQLACWMGYASCWHEAAPCMLAAWCMCGMLPVACGCEHTPLPLLLCALGFATPLLAGWLGCVVGVLQEGLYETRALDRSGYSQSPLAACPAAQPLSLPVCSFLSLQLAAPGA
jgi:hypothetical protein